MTDTDKIRATATTPIAFRVPVWIAAALLSAALGLTGGAIWWLHDSASNQKLQVQAGEQQVQALLELKTEVKELRHELGEDNKRLRDEVNKLRERVSALEAKVK